MISKVERDLHELNETILWDIYKNDSSNSARVKLIEKYLPFAKHVAASLFAKRINDEIEFDDYHQLANEGLIESMNRYDHSMGVSFVTYSYQRIKGAVLNGIEIQTEKQQQISMLKRIRKERLNSLKESLADGLNETEHANTQDAFKLLAEIGVGLAIAWMLEDTGLASHESDSMTHLPFYKGIELRQLQNKLKQNISKLEDKESKFITYHYFHGISMTEIAEIMGVTRGRVSQINRSALKKLKDFLLIDNWEGSCF